MTIERIKEIQAETAYPDSISVQQALLQVWNECEQEQLRIHDVVGQSEQVCGHCKGKGYFVAGLTSYRCPCRPLKKWKN